MAAPDREKALGIALAQIEKQFGKGSVMRLGDEGRAPVEVIPTGSIALDLALGIGGLPRGRVIEIYGPESSGKTTVTLHAVASVQAAGGIAAFIDAEHALDPEYAKALGVDTDSLLVSQPDTGEQALEIADMLIRSGAIDLVVVDSVAALVPRAEIEGEMGDNHVGLQARLMSQALRKITGALSTTGTTMIFINQLREKIGVMFGCFSYDTEVVLADGTTEKIGAIVEQKQDIEVLSYDPDADAVVPRRVVNWFDNGVAERFLQFTVAKAGGAGPAHFAATENHLIRTPGGWRHAGELIAGDRVMVAEQQRLSDQQWQVLLGSLLGSANLLPLSGDAHGVSFQFSHEAPGRDYLEWKTSLLGNIAVGRRHDAPGTICVESVPLPELDELQRAVYLGGGAKTIGWEYLKALTPLSLAIWYMDAGSLSADEHVWLGVGSVSAGSQERLADYLRDTHGLAVSVRSSDAAGAASLVLDAVSSRRFLELVAPYLHPCMAGKTVPELRGRFEVQPQFVEPTLRPVPARIVDVHVAPREGSMHRYDIEVEGSHSYFVDGVMVHNSPETTTGGKALKFYSSVRLDIRRIEALKDGSDIVGNRTRVKVVKNKVAPPFKQAEFDIIYGQGISREGSLLDVGVEQGLVRKAGAWYTYDGEQLGQGKENARTFLRENPDVADEIEKRIKDKLGVGARIDADEPAPAPVDF